MAVDPTDHRQYRAVNDVDSDAVEPHSDATNWALAGSTQLIGNTIDLLASAGNAATTVNGASEDLSTGTLDVASTSAFADKGQFTVAGGSGPCSYTGTSGRNKFTGITGCTGTPANGAAVASVGIFENGNGKGITHAALQLIYTASVKIHGASAITAGGDVTASSTVDVTATANSAGQDAGSWSSATAYLEDQVVTDPADDKRYKAKNNVGPSATSPSADTTNWEDVDSKDTSVAAAQVYASGTSQLSGTSAILAATGAVKIKSNVKTNITTKGDSTLAGSGAGIAIVVLTTFSKAFIDSTAATPVTAQSLVVSADTDNTAPTTGIAAVRGAKGNDNSANGGGTTDKGAWADATAYAVDDQVTSNGQTYVATAAHTSAPETQPGVGADWASDWKLGAESSRADGKSKTSDGNQNLTAALAVAVLVAETTAYIAPTDASTPHAITTTGGTQTVHAGAKNSASATANAGNVKFSPDAPTFTDAADTGGFLNGGTSYFYRVSATFSSGESLAGSEAKYDAPSGTNTNKITVNWTAVSGATGYKIYRGTATGEELLLATVGAVTTYTDDTNATPAGAMPTSDTSSGVGIAVGVTVAVVSTRAYLAGNAVLDATDVTVEALGPGSGDSAFSAHATSGAGGSSVGVAGSIAVNIVVADTIADIEAPTPVVVNGNVSLIATSSLTNEAAAEAKQESGGNTSGIGASVALNVVNDTTRAGLADGSVLTGARTSRSRRPRPTR